MGIFFLCFYGAFAGIALLNLLMMRRAKAPISFSPPTEQRLCILIPARNEQANLARLLPALLGPGSEGTIPPKVYVFDSIPNTMNPKEVIIICSVSVLAAVLGALVPAIRAASLHPVESLRWE